MALSRLRVLYLHGFEEGPLSPKPQALVMRGDVLELCMPPLGVYLTRANSPIVGALHSHTLRLYLIVLMTTFLVLYLASDQVPRRVAVILVLVALFSFASLWKKVKQEAFSYSLQKSFAIAQQKLREFQPDVVVGFSWGGCLATMLLNQGFWAGPTLLLAPAYELLLKFANGSDPRLKLEGLPQSATSNVVVVASETDQIVPIERTRALCNANSLRLIIAEGEGNEKHAMFGIARDGTLLDLVLQIAKRK